MPLTHSRLLNDCYHLKVYAYRSHDRQTMRTLDAAFRPVRRDWLRSKDVPPLRKLKVLCMEGLMLAHAPVSLVDRAFNARRSHG